MLFRAFPGVAGGDLGQEDEVGDVQVEAAGQPLQVAHHGVEGHPLFVVVAPRHGLGLCNGLRGGRPGRGIAPEGDLLLHQFAPDTCALAASSTASIANHIS